MAVDSGTASSTASSVPRNTEDSSKKGKAGQGKKVCSCIPHVLDTNCRDSTQTPEKRPEVRFQESPSVLAFRSILTLRGSRLIIPMLLKRLALVSEYTLHSFAPCDYGLSAVITASISSSEMGLLPRETLDSIAAIVAADSGADPSLKTLLSHIGDLEQEVRDADFRLHFLYRQRLATLSMLATAKGRAEDYKA